MGQEVAFGQIVQTQRKRKESKRLDKLSRRRKRGDYAYKNTAILLETTRQRTW